MAGDGKKARRGGKKHRKHGRQHRRPSGLRQAARTYKNKLARVNRDREKSGKPPLAGLPPSTYAWMIANTAKKAA